MIPPLVLLIGYWTSGLLFVAPMPRIERVLLGIDRALDVRRAAAAVPHAVAEFLEIAYVAVYPVIPIALIIHLTTTGATDANRFWTVILLTDYVCFGMLPWIQTRPPRALEPNRLGCALSIHQPAAAREDEHSGEHLPQRPRRRRPCRGAARAGAGPTPFWDSSSWPWPSPPGRSWAATTTRLTRLRAGRSR